MATQLPSQKGSRSPKFSVHLYCGQTAGCIKMPLGTEVGLGLRDIVFDVDPVSPRKRAHPPPPNFGPCLLWPSGWMDEDAAWCGSRPRPRPHVLGLDGVPAPAKGAQSAQKPPLFGPCLLWPRSPPSQLLLSSCSQHLTHMLNSRRPYQSSKAKSELLGDGTLCHKIDQYRVNRCFQNRLHLECAKNHSNNWFRRFEDEQ